ncbi:unnamed protein product, partial [Staurois parvus]
QLCPITADHIGDIYTDSHQCPDFQCSPISAAFQCPSLSRISAHQCQISVSINATYQCPLELPFSAHVGCLSPISVNHCCLSVPITAAYQCHLSLPVSAHQ